MVSVFAFFLSDQSIVIKEIAFALSFCILFGVAQSAAGWRRCWPYSPACGSEPRRG
jgi:hypothetical protein